MKHEIEIPDLPEGWEAIEFRLGCPDEYYFDAYSKKICRLLLTSSVGVMIVRKKQPRRIVLEEVEAGHRKVEFFHDRRCWKIVEDNKCAE